METSSRLYYCALCRIQCLICSPCDRGQIYCSPNCSQAARKNSIRMAEKRYQKTYRGRMNHSLRQRHYRLRLKQKVTDQGSQRQPRNALLQPVKNKAVLLGSPLILTCCCCQKPTSTWIRYGFLRHGSNRQRDLIQQPP